MASIHEFAPTPSDSDLNKTNFSTNYGFNIVSNNPLHQGINGLNNGLYYYANAHKNPQALAEAQTYFGSQLLDRQFADYWVGEALVSQGGFKNITDAYIAFDIPIPDNVSDPRQLSATLGRNVLEKHSAEYDKRAEARRKQTERVSNNFSKLISGSISPADLLPEDIKEIQDVYGYSAHDIYAAGLILKARKDRAVGNLAMGPLASTALALPVGLQRAGEAAGALIKGNPKQAWRALTSGGTADLNRGYERALEVTHNAYANAMVQDSRFLEMATNPQKALEIAAAVTYKRDKEAFESVTMAERLLAKGASAIYDVYQGYSDLATMPVITAAQKLGADTPDLRRGMQSSAALKGAEALARAEVQKTRGIMGWLEQGGDFAIDTAAIANPFTAGGATASLFRDNAGGIYNKITDENGIIDPNVSPLQIYGKAAGSAYITWATRSWGARFMTRIMNKGLTKLGVNSVIGNAAGSWAWSTINFAAFVPAADAAANYYFDEACIKDPRLKTGWKAMQQLHEDLGTPKHWVVSSVPGLTTTAKGSRDYARASRALTEHACSRGLNPAEAEAIRRNTPLEELPKALTDAVNKKIKENPQEALENGISYTRSLIEQEQQRAVEENGKQVSQDAAKQAALRLYGISLSQGADPAKTTIHIGSKVDPETGKYVEGTTIIELPTADAEFYLGSIFNRDAANRAEAIRNAFANGLFIDAAQQTYGDKIRIDAISSPFDFNHIISQGKQAESLIKSRTKDLIESTKDKDGKPTLSEADARARAAKEVHPDLHKSESLEKLVHYGKEAQRRLDNETKRNQSIDPDASFQSRAYVISKGSREKGSYTRILKIADGASTREMSEEYSEIWMEDYIFNERLDYCDIWRQMFDLSSELGKDHPSLTSLQNTNPELTKKLNENNLTDADIADPSILQDIRTDVREAFSRLLMANLHQMALDGKLPDWATPLIAAKFGTDLAMQQEMALAATIKAAESVGKKYETINRLLGLETQQVENILKSIQPPTVDDYTEAYVKSANTYAALVEGETRTADEVESILAEQAQQEHLFQEEIRQQEEQRSAPFVEAVKEAESLPENKDKSHEQIVQEVNEKAIEAKEEQIENAADVVKDKDTVNGIASKIKDKNGNVVCLSGVMAIEKLKMMPNFKSGSDKDTGEVHALTGTYHPDHDPIRVFRQYDGTILVISGRHRLAHAKRYNAKNIPVYIYDESPTQDLAWCQIKDVEWNIKDNQATALDVALLIRGELVDGVPPLTKERLAQMGALRDGSISSRGYMIGVNASSELMDAWRNDPETFTDDIVSRIALFAPNDADIQKAGIRNVQNGITSKQSLLKVLGWEAARIKHLKESGDYAQLDLFNNSDFDTVYNNFVNKYSLEKIAKLNKTISQSKLLDKTVKTEEGLDLASEKGLRIDNAARKRKNKEKTKAEIAQEQLPYWENPWTNMDVIGEEINKKFAEEHPEEWAKMQERKRELEAQQQALNDTPAEEAPDLGNEVKGDTSDIPSFNFSTIGKNAKTWDKYVDKAFKGRKDGLMRAEIDSSQSKLTLPEYDKSNPIALTGKTYRLGDIFEYKELYEAYPHLAELPVTFTYSLGNLDGAFYRESDFGSNYLKINTDLLTKDNDKIRATFLHEIQHAIQDFEGFEYGYTNYSEDNFNWDDYYQNEGEREAENVERRMNMSQQGRDNSYFYSTMPRMATTANFSITSEATLQTWQIDKSYGLGTLGHFTDPLNYKLQNTGIDVIDQRVKAMHDRVKRRYKELRHVHGEERATLIAAEMSAIFNELERALPHGYGFGLEPYHEFSNIYANLRKTGNPDEAPQSLPMRHWPEIMAKSFRNQFEDLLRGNLSEVEEYAFYEKYHDLGVSLYLSNVKKDLDKTRSAYMKQVNQAYPKDQRKTKEYKQARAQAREQAYQDVASRHRDVVEAAYKALATIRAEKLVNKFFDRVLVQLDNYRKDRILKIMNRALASINPKKTSDGKPIKGSVPLETYREVLTNYRLLRLTKAQKENFEDTHPDLTNLADDATLDIETYNEKGEPITLKVTKEQYETYASLDAMTGDQAASAAQALGTLIATGKEAWKQQQEMEKAQVQAFCSPIYQNYSESEDQYGQSLRSTQRDTFSKEEANAVKGLLIPLTNDGQLVDFISSIKGLEHFKSLHNAIANAHSYEEKAEEETRVTLIRATAAACGFTNINPYNPTKEQARKMSEFSNDINDIKDVNFTFTPQAPDFMAQQTSLHRTAILRRLFRVTRKKNFNPHELATAMQSLRNTMPAEIYQEAMDLYGNIGDPSKYKGELTTALNNVFPAVKFGYLRNLDQSIKNKAKGQLGEWKKNNSTKPYTITKLTRNEAAYRVLMFEQEDYTDLMYRQGYTDDMIAKLEKFAGADMMAYAYALRDAMNARMPQIKAIYEATYGTPFPEVENYFRAFFDVNTQQQADSSMQGLATGSEGKSGGSIKLFYTRIKHNAKIMPTMTVTHAFYLGMKQQTNLIAYADTVTHRHIGEFMRKVMANKQDGQELRKALENAIGKPATDALDTQIEHMYRIYGHADAYASTANRLIRDIGAGAAFGLLTWNIASLAKNSLAIFNTLGGSEHVGPLDWAKSLWRVTWGQGIKKGKDLAKEDFIKSRFKGMNTELYMNSILQMAGVKQPVNSLTKFAQQGLEIFGKYDRYCTSKSAAVMYDAAYRNFQKKDPSLTPDALNALALQEVKNALTVKGQPLGWRSRPIQSSRNSWMTAAHFFLGGEALATFGDCVRLAMRTEWSQLFNSKDPERRARARRNLANLFAVWTVNGLVYSLMGLGFAALLDDEEQWRKRKIGTSLLGGTLWGPVTGVPVLAGVAGELTRLLGINYYMPSASYLPMADFSKTAREFKKLYKEDSSGLDRAVSATYSARDILSIFLMSTQRPTTKTGAAIKTASMFGTAVSNILNFVLRGTRAADERFTK